MANLAGAVEAERRLKRLEALPLASASDLLHIYA
jgi:hypothetical protein